MPTVTYVPTENPDGSYGEPQFIYDSGNRGLHHGMPVDAAEDYYENEVGEYRHRFSDVDPNVVESYEEDYTEDDPSYFDEVDALPPQDIDYLMNLAGGEQQYQQLTRWAYNNLPDETIDQFDAVVDSNDVEEIEGFIQWLLQQYEEANGSQEFYEAEGEEEVDEDAATDAEFANDVLTEYPDILDATAWAAETFDDVTIRNFNNALDGDDYSLKADAINWLMNTYHSYSDNDY